MKAENMDRFMRILTQLEELNSDNFIYELKASNQWFTLSINGKAEVSYRRAEGDEAGLRKIEAFLIKELP